MLKNYFRVAWRNISRHKANTVINVLGLALGICACLVIWLVVSYDLSFDRFHPNQDRIFRIVGEMQKGSGETEFLNSPFPDVAGIQEAIPGFESKAGLIYYDAGISIPNGKNPPKKFENRIPGSHSATAIITWPAYFDIFKYQWLEGSSESLREPFRVVLSEKRAKTYFGDIPLESMIGKTVIYEDSLKLTVSGIVKDWAENTDFGYTDFISISTVTNSFLKSNYPHADWSSLRPHNAMAFVKLSPGVSGQAIEKSLDRYVQDHVRIHDPGARLRMFLQPLTEIHFTKQFRRGDDGDDFRKAHLPTLYTLMSIAIFILIIAAVNFINLSTAQSISRAKEIGVRKVLGGNKSNISIQFLIETLMLTLFAVLLSILLVNPMLSIFKEYLPEGVVFEPLKLSSMIFLLSVTVITTLLAGFYPSRVLASYLPSVTLRGNAMHQGPEKGRLRKGLIVFQFSISMVFIIMAIVMSKQINFMKNSAKGFNSDAIITISKWGDRGGKLKSLAESIKGIPGIDQVIWQGNPPMGFAQTSGSFKYKGSREIQFQPIFEVGDEGFIPFYQMKIVAGRNLIHGDSLKELVVNETLARTIGFDNQGEVVGKTLTGLGRDERPYEIVGVVADFHQGSFHDPIQPAIIINENQFKYAVAIKLTSSAKKAKDVADILSSVEKEWKKRFPDQAFNYVFMNESIGWLFDQDEKTAWLINVAMAITIFISCMGLFGLGMFTARRKTKEIGIRKVLGASVTNIAAMLTHEFVILILISMLIAVPVAFYFMHQWLQDFVYRTNLSWWVFGLAGILAILIALITVGFQAIKAAIANPVASLRSE